MSTALAEKLEPITGPSRLRVNAETVLKANNLSPTAAKVPLLHEVMRDPAQILALLNVSPIDFERRVLAYLQECASQMKPKVEVHQHIRKPPTGPAAKQQKLAEQRKIAMKVAVRQATVIMNIDGVDIRDWTIGQCLTAGRRKTHEAYVLRVIGAQYGHLDHGKRIGDLADDAWLTSLVQLGRAHAEQG